MQFKPDGEVGKVAAPLRAPQPAPPPVAHKTFTPKAHRDPNKIITMFETGPLKSWSFSSLSVYEQCPLRSKFKSIDKISEPSTAALARGSEIHDLAERYVRGLEGEEVPLPLQQFEKGFTQLKEEFAAGKVTCEEEWAFRKDWSETGWMDDDCWHRAKLDAFLVGGDGSALIVDYKTGKKFGNELKHGEQGLVYAIGAFLKYPELDFIKIEFWYLDKGEKLIRNFTRQQALLFQPQLHQRAVKMTTAVEFEAKPSFVACRWCHYGKEGICKEVFDASQL